MLPTKHKELYPVKHKIYIQLDVIKPCKILELSTYSNL